MRLLRCDISYDGTRFSGWQRQKTTPLTVQQILEEVLFRILQERIVLTGASRTDAGVHAVGQVAHFRTRSMMPLVRLRWSANSLLPPDILLRRIRSAPESFHARYGAVRKRYRYRIWNAPDRSVWERVVSWHLRRPLDLVAMRRAARLLEGRRDFRAFSAVDRRRRVRSMVRSLYAVRVRRKVPWVEVEMEADGFLYNMARTIVGTLVEVGLGKRAVPDVRKALAGKDRRLAGQTAPARGLCLMWVKYG